MAVARPPSEALRAVSNRTALGDLEGCGSSVVRRCEMHPIAESREPAMSTSVM
jgi:hypothetical protein